MSAAVLRHMAREGERWDHLALRYYGSGLEIGRLIDANPQIALCEVLPAGTVVLVPVIAGKPRDQADLPPWLRQG